jgi:hypothetical protein
MFQNPIWRSCSGQMQSFETDLLAQEANLADLRSGGGPWPETAERGITELLLPNPVLLRFRPALLSFFVATRL